jgi:putative restriction endonuclease
LFGEAQDRTEYCPSKMMRTLLRTLFLRVAHHGFSDRRSQFRDALMDYCGGRCPITGITDPPLLRASHIVPWSECGDEQRLDVHNGLLLSALWDAAFDKGLVSFADDGKPLASPRLSEVARNILALDQATSFCGLRDAHRANLAIHRARHGLG